MEEGREHNTRHRLTTGLKEELASARLGGGCASMECGGRVKPLQVLDRKSVV